jgi:hypothetical protein
MATVKNAAPAAPSKVAAKVAAKVVTKVATKVATKGQAPIAPEVGGGAVKKRTRLAKVFKRPLDKTLRNVTLVREKFSILGLEYEQLLEMKQQLSDLGLPVKKSELVRAGLLLLTDLDELELKEAVLKVQALG